MRGWCIVTTAKYLTAAGVVHDVHGVLDPGGNSCDARAPAPRDKCGAVLSYPLYQTMHKVNNEHNLRATAVSLFLLVYVVHG